MVVAATFSGTAYAEENIQGWGPVRGYSTGGNPFETTDADWGPYTGAHLWSGSYYGRFFDRIQFSTWDLDPGWTDVYGSWGGAVDNGVEDCNGFVVGIKGHADYYVDSLGLICSDGAYRYEFGGSGGNKYYDKCAPGLYVMRIRGHAGSWMDSIQIYCGEPWWI
jgi:hypothetical protein